MRYKIAEQLGAIDYFISLQNWLQPRFVFADIHKRLTLTLIAGIYECVLENMRNIVVRQEYENSKLLKHFIPVEKIEKRDDDKFEVFINDACEMKMIDNDWKEHLHRVREIRNWLHLSKERKENVKDWFDKLDLNEVRNRLEQFRRLTYKFIQDL